MNGNSGTAASPVSHFQRPFSPSSAYPPPTSLNSNIVIMQHGRMMGKPRTECLLYTLRNIFQFTWQRLQTIAEYFYNEGIVYSSTLGSKCKKIIAFIVRYSSDPELELLLSVITCVCVRVISCHLSSSFAVERPRIRMTQPVQPL